MAKLDQFYDVNTLPVSESYEPLPEGWYTAVIKSSELKYTKSGTGQYILVRWVAAHHGIADILNIRNDSAKAEEIGKAKLGELLRAVGVARINDSDQLIGLSAEIRLVIKEQPGYKPSNEVKSYRARATQGQKSAQIKPPLPKPEVLSSPPWNKNQIPATPVDSSSEDDIPF